MDSWTIVLDANLSPTSCVRGSPYAVLDLIGTAGEVPPDPILGLVAAFKADPAERKVNLAQGACARQ